MADKPFDLEAFKAFVASKPAGEVYDGGSLSLCALAQFGVGAHRSAAHADGVSEAVYLASINGYRVSTWGALLSRLSSLDPEGGR